MRCNVTQGHVTPLLGWIGKSPQTTYEIEKYLAYLFDIQHVMQKHIRI